MGKPNRSRVKRKKAPKDKQPKKVTGSAKESYSIDDILDKVEEYIDTFQYELAQKFCQRALEMDNDNIRALETSGFLLLELGNMDAAKNCFGRVVELEPESGHSKYMYLGQLLTGIDAIKCFQKGIELMKKSMEESDGAGACSAEDGKPTAKDISSAYCAIAEIYLTDSCFEDDAESKCKECLELAIQSDSENCEAYQLMASFLLSKDDKEGARNNIEKSVALWLPQLQEAEKAEGSNIDPVQVCPVSYLSRMNAAKILIEVEKYDIASEILELLLEEEEEVIEVWYLLGWLHFLQGEDYKENARHYLTKGNELAVKLKFDDKTLMAHLTELLEKLGPAPAENDENIPDDDNDLEMDSDDDDLTNGQKQTDNTEESMDL